MNDAMVLQNYGVFCHRLLPEGQLAHKIVIGASTRYVIPLETIISPYLPTVFRRARVVRLIIIPHGEVERGSVCPLIRPLTGDVVKTQPYTITDRG